MTAAVAKRRLTPLQERFVDEILKGNPVLRAAEFASVGSPHVHAYRIAALSQVQRAIAEGMAKRFTTEAAPLAYSVLTMLLLVVKE